MVHAYKRVRRGAAVLGILLASLATKGAAQWTALPDMGEVRYASQSTVLNGKLYFWDGVPTADLTTYYFADTAQVAKALDLANPTAWTAIPNLPFPTRGGFAAAVGGKIYIVGGGSIDPSAGTAGLNTNVFVFDPSNSSFTTKTASPVVPVMGAAGFVVGGKIYLVGGLGVVGQSYAYVNTVQVYDPVANSWTKLNDAPFTGAFMASTVLGSDMYMIDGYRVVGTALNYTNAAYKGTVSGNTVTWTPIANYPIATGKASAGVLNGKVYVAGGEGQTGGLAASYTYDPTANTWTGNYLMPVGVSYAAPLQSGPGQLVLVGGSDNVGTYKFVPGTPKAVVGVGPTEIAISVEKGNSSSAQFAVVNNGVIDLTGTIEIPTDAQAWLTSDKSNLIIQPGNGSLITLTGNSAALNAGMYKTTVNVKSNDPDHATTPVTVRLFVAEKLMTQATNVVLEEGTGNWCGWCPYAHEIVDQLKEAHPDNLVVISYHGGSATEPMKITEGESLMNKLGLNGWPNAAVQRWLFQGQSTRMVDRGAFDAAVSTVLQNQPNAPVAFELQSYSFDAASRKVTATVKVTTTMAIPLQPGSSLRLTTVVTEDSLNYKQHKYLPQSDGSVKETDLTPYYHNDVARVMYPNSNGIEIQIPEEAMTENYVLPGQSFTQDIEFTVPSAVKPNHAHTAFIVHRFDGGLLTEAFQGFGRPLVGTVSNTASFSVTVAQSTANIQIHDTAKFQTMINNTGNVAITITPSRTANNLPDANWKSWFCLSGSNCTLPDDNSGDPITIQPGTSATIIVKVLGANTGQGKVTMHFASGDQQVDKEYTVNASETPASVDEHVVTGNSLRLSQNSPNPASTSTHFTYSVATATNVAAEIFTINGEKVMTVGNGRVEAGEHAFDVNVAGLPSGVYTVRLTAGYSTVTRMMTVAH